MAFSRNHLTAPDSTFSPTGAIEWARDHSVSGATVGGIPYCPTATTEATSANFLYTETSGPRLQVGSGSTTSQGWIFGQRGSGLSTIWSTANGVGALATVAIEADGSNVSINAPAGQTLFYSAATLKGGFRQVDGAGFFISAGTATTDVQAVSGTQTVNAAGVTFISYNYDVTYTASAAGSLHSRWRGGAGGTTVLASLSKAGLYDAVAYSVGGAAGADFGPGLPTSITVVKGIITAIS